MDNALVKADDLKKGILYKLRLNKLSSQSRTLQKHNVINNDGFLTVVGAQVFLDTLWQNNPEIQKQIATELDEISKKEKKEK